MNVQVPKGFEFQHVYCFPNTEQPLSYYYLPLQIQPQRDADGTPMVNLVSVGTGGFLQLSVSWDAPSALLDALRQEIAQRETLDNPAELRLAFAPITLQQVSLLLGTGGETFDAIATSKSSGFPPYTALFSVQLNAEQQAQVAAALNGRENFLQVEYNAILNGFAEASATLTGDASAVIAQFKGSRRILNHHEVQAILEQAITSDQLQITVDASNTASAQLIDRVKTQTLTQSVDLLLRFLQGEERIPDITRLQVSVSLTEPHQVTLELKTDIATWFSNRSGTQQIQPAPGAIAFPSPTHPPTLSSAPSAALPIYLTFTPTDAPVALISIQQGTAKTTLTPPDFSATLSALSKDEPLAVETSYTTGGGYQSRVPSPPAGELALSPADLGLVQVQVDATALEAIATKKARIWLRYRPDGAGIANETTIYFRDRPWQADWFVISRSKDLQGVLTYEWQVTTENGDVIKREMTETTSPHVVLALEEQLAEDS